MKAPQFFDSIRGKSEVFNEGCRLSLIHIQMCIRDSVQTVMKDKGMAHICIGSAQGDDKAIEAVKLAVASPLLAVSYTHLDVYKRQHVYTRQYKACRFSDKRIRTEL